MTTSGVRHLLGAGALALVAALGACGGPGDEDDPGTLPATTAPDVTVAPTPTTTPPADVDPKPVASGGPTTVDPPETTSAPEPAATTTAGTDLADGRHVAFLVAVDPMSQTVRADVAQFFVGAQAAEAAAEDGDTEYVGDWYVRNTNTVVRTLHVVDGALVTVNVLAADGTRDASEDLDVTLEQLAGYDGLEHHLFWLTVEDGVVTAIEQQFVP